MVHVRLEGCVNLPGRKFPQKFSNRDPGLIKRTNFPSGDGRDGDRLFSSHDCPVAFTIFAWRDDSLLEDLDISVLEQGIDFQIRQPSGLFTKDCVPRF